MRWLRDVRTGRDRKRWLLAGASSLLLGLAASPALAACADGDGQVTGPGATCTTPQALAGSNTTGTVATGWTLNAGGSTAYTVSGSNDTVTNAGNITSSSGTATVSITGASDQLENQGQISDTGVGAAVSNTNATAGAIDNAAGASITAGGGTGAAISIAGNVSGAISNEGSLISAGGNAIQIVGNVADLLNSGGNIQAAGGVAVMAGMSLLNAGGGTFLDIGAFGGSDNGGVAGNIVNSGNISGEVGIFANTVGGEVNNSGNVAATYIGVEVATGAVVNSGNITATNGPALVLGAPIGATAPSLLGGPITNMANGVISGSGDGVDVQGALAGGLDNDGAIHGGTWGILVSGNLGGDLFSTGQVNGGTQAAVQVAGTVSGDVSLSGNVASTSNVAVRLTAVTGNVSIGGNLGDGASGSAAVVVSSIGGTLNFAPTLTGPLRAVKVSGAVGGDLISGASLSAPGEGIYLGEGAFIFEADGKTVEQSTQDAIFIGGNFTGNIVNAGKIDAVNNGIYVNRGVIGSAPASIGGITNSGTITVTGPEPEGSGIESALTVRGDVTNSGTISAAVGIGLGAAVLGNLVNSGNIVASDEGLNALPVGGNLINSGNIAATNFAVATGNVGGDVINTSTGNVSNTALVPLFGGGGFAVGSVLGNLSNAGQISGRGVAMSAVGVEGNVSNSGQLNDDVGIYINGPVGGGIDNALGGNLAASAGNVGVEVNGIVGPDGDGNTRSLVIAGLGASDVRGNVSNEGVISAGNQGILVLGVIHGDLINTGTITSSSGDGIDLGGFARGEQIGSVVGDVTAGGAITAALDDISINGDVGGNVVLPTIGTLAFGDDGIVVGGNVGGNVTVASGRVLHLTSGVGIQVGEGTAPPASGVGVAVTGLAAGIVNDGNITVDAGTAIKVGGGATAGGVTLWNDGTLRGGGGTAIDYSAATGPSTLNEENGGVFGAVLLSSHGDTLNISGGAITGAISGGGGVQAGTINFDVAASGGFVIQAPISVANVNIVSGPVYMSADVTVDQTVTNNGSLAFLDYDTHNITGQTVGTPAYVQGAGGNLIVAVQPASASLLNVNGTASLNGTVTFDYAQGTYHPKTYVFLQATGISGQFATVLAGPAQEQTTSTGTISSLPGGFDQSVSYSPTTVSLALATSPTPTPPTPTPPTPTPPTPTPPTPTPPTPTPAPPAPTPPAPTPTPPAPTPTPPAPTPTPPAPTPTPTSLVIAPRDATLFSAMTFAFGEAGQDDLAALLGRSQADGGGDSFYDLGGAAGPPARGWLEGIGAYIDPSTPDRPTFHASSGGLEGGADVAVGPGGRVGAALGYESASLSDGDGGGASQTLVRVSLYASQSFGPVGFSAVVAYAHASQTFDRAAGLGAAAAGRGVDDIDGAFEATAPLAVGGFAVKPVAGVLVSSLRASAFSESDAASAAFALSGAAANQTAVSPFASLSVSRRMTTSSGWELTPDAEAGFRYDAIAAGLNQTLIAADGTPFFGNGAGLDRDSALLGVSLTAHKGGWTGFVKYRASVAGDWNDQSVNLGLRYSF
ncbi:MAG TPA: autotransporter outer membrane beta-barrel domain-containing protein [Caulobacteraceae bacterium]|jgi:hypothetical protein